ncbi:antibiotic biosynthesis monooxygenase [Blastococcus goldschmidtiae]|uniref:Antibiotic biosynthesis monooxygenase n=1 Tax=Blastococcus goldschmidtiae TaxID=3075546 RepID=A0ABU2KDX6_9ACTN|nr:antibiotic biosynthesis monooxygenase [Blastococcus sp. DSM 46792]MDT0278384.1 antibiotic biosynthesis monooxygenase [Blastococcus sp. DSM 46792]
MFAVLYRWRIDPDREDAFRQGWELVTRAIHRSCGSHGSRLHRADDGTWIAYALWPDAATRERCDHAEDEGRRLMAEAVVERFPETTMTVASDLLHAPA